MSRSHSGITTAWHSVMKRKCEERDESFEEEATEAVSGDKRRKNAGHHTNVVIYAGVLRTYDMTGFTNANYKP